MLVGAAREIINPELGHRICGYGPDYPNTGVHDDLAVTALYLNDGTRQAVLLNYDIIGLTTAMIKRIRTAVAQAVGNEPEQIFLACTHTHSGPFTFDSEPFDPANTMRGSPAAYLEKLLNWSVQAATQAKAAAEECQLRYNFAYAEENMNRRFNFPDRQFFYIPDHKQLAGTSKEYVDRELGIVAFRKKGTPNQYKAIITNYTCHPLCVGNSSNLLSADFQGVMRRRIEETFSGCLCLATTGAAGDNHPLTPEGGFVAAEQMGNNLARLAITRVYDAVPAEGEEQLRLAYPEMSLPFADAATRQMLPENLARQDRLNWKKKEHPTFVSLLGIGPILFAGVPGELMAELGATLKWSSPFLKSYVLFTATDFAGYFPTVNQFYWGGYETNTSSFARGAGEKIVRCILDAANQLIQERPLNLPALDAKASDGRAS